MGSDWMGLNLFRWVQMVSDGFIWVHIGSDGFRWVQMGSDGFRWVQMGCIQKGSD